jgi:hypothetical protein
METADLFALHETPPEYRSRQPEAATATKKKKN